jgi:hypothetical protein
MASVEQRVRAGATLLDASVPGWAGKINGEGLNIGDCVACMLGQLYGFYHAGLVQLGMDGDLGACSYAHGFTVLWSRFGGIDIDAEYAALRVCWLAEIAARLDAGEDETLTSPVDTEACPL